MPRTFIAFSAPCPPTLARLLKELGQLGSPVKASSPRGLHCTLKFLGETSGETVARLGPALAAAVQGFPSFTVRLRGVGAFPDAGRPNVVWGGLAAPELAGLHQRIESLADEFGFVPDARPFHPHITLARIKHRPPPRLAQCLQDYAATDWGEFEVDAIELFQSTLTPAGSRYTVLARAPLGL